MIYYIVNDCFKCKEVCFDELRYSCIVFIVVFGVSEGVDECSVEGGMMYWYLCWFGVGCRVRLCLVFFIFV